MLQWFRAGRSVSGFQVEGSGFQMALRPDGGSRLGGLWLHALKVWQAGYNAGFEMRLPELYLVYICTDIHIYTCVYIYIYTHTWSHTHTHAHTGSR